MKIKEALNSGEEKYPVFSLLTREIRDFTEELERLSVIDDDGRLYDSRQKTPELI